MAMTGKVLVMIVSAVAMPEPPAWHLEYEVRNAGDKPVWLVVDENLVFRHEDSRIELSFARGQMQPGVQVFGYFNPAVEELPPGESLRRAVEIPWPSPLSDIWNAGREATPSPGDYEVKLRVGFGMSEAPDAAAVGESVEAPVLRWQHTAVSAPVSLAVPPYQRSR